ncbi:MAG: C25 family cysteine peptidase, partial [bacterium]
DLGGVGQGINDDYLLLRMRMVGDPSANANNDGGWSSQHWNFLVSTETDFVDENGVALPIGYDYKEYWLDVEGGSNTLRVIYENEPQQDLTVDPESGNLIVDEFVSCAKVGINKNASVDFSLDDTADGSKDCDTESWTRVIAADEEDGDGSDSDNYWVDIMVPVRSLLDAPYNGGGTATVDEDTVYRHFYSTSNSATDPLQKDYITDCVESGEAPPDGVPCQFGDGRTDTERDFGDAPASYGEASHEIPGSIDLYIGSTVPDAEGGSFYSTDADGDDGNNTADEEGVVLTAVRTGASQFEIEATVTVTNSSGSTATLCGWMDFDDTDNGNGVDGSADGDFSSHEGTCITVPASGDNANCTDEGSNVFTCTVTNSTYWLPDYSSAITTYTRFRLSSDALATSDSDDSASGPASDGEGTDIKIVVAASLATIGQVEAIVDQSGDIHVAWETSSEAGSKGFHVERYDLDLGKYVRVNQGLLPAVSLVGHQQGGRYSLLDSDAREGQPLQYRIVESELRGGERTYGPFMVEPRVETGETEMFRSRFTGTPHALAKPRVAATKQKPGKANRAALVGIGAGAIVKVREDGLQHVSGSQLSSVMGFSLPDVFNSNFSLRITNQGQPVSWWPDASGTGVYFYGTGIDSLYTLDNVYQFGVGKASQADLISGAPRRGAIVSSAFHTKRLENNVFAATVATEDPNEDYWYGDALLAGTPGWDAKIYAISVDELSAGDALAIRLSGGTPDRHTVEVRLNGQHLGYGNWEGLGSETFSFNLPAGLLVEGNNQVELLAIGQKGHVVYMDKLEVSYLRKLVAINDRLSFELDRPDNVEVSGFITTNLQVLDITVPNSPLRMVNVELVGGKVTFNGLAGHRYLVVASNQANPLQLEADPGSAIFKHTGQDTLLVSKGLGKQRPEHLVVAPREFQAGAQALSDYRNGTGIKSVVVLLEDIYRHYNHGIESPHAITDFLEAASQKWNLRFVTLAGDGSFDYRDFMGQAENFVPTMMAATPEGLFACDGCLADFDGDSKPELVVARIPASSNAEIITYVDKLAGYESGAALGNAVMAADKIDLKVGDFKQSSEELSTLVSGSYQQHKIYLDDLSLNDAHNQLVSRIEAGTDWVNFVGHGSANQFGNSALLTRDDVDALTNARTPIVSSLTCAVNRFEFPGYDSVGEKLVMKDASGAVAAWAPSGLSKNLPATEMGLTLFDQVYQQNYLYLGEAVDGVLHETQGTPPYLNKIYNLLGDSAVRIQLK